MRVLTILARFGQEQYARAEQDVDDVFRRVMPDVDRDLLIVDNALPTSSVADFGRRMLIGGDNSVHEFSAFDRGVQFMGSRIWQYDLINPVTSAFNQLYVAYLERFSTPLLRVVSNRPVCVGHIDSYNSSVDLFGIRMQHWIRTAFFMMPPAELKLLGRFVTVREGSRFFSHDPAAPFRPDAPLDSTYRRYIVDWLTGGDIGQGVTWHSRFALTVDQLPAFESKALAILNEHLMSVCLRAMGCRLIDVTWLATIQRAAQAKVDWSTSWQQQLANRDRDALLLST